MERLLRHRRRYSEPSARAYILESDPASDTERGRRRREVIFPDSPVAAREIAHPQRHEPAWRHLPFLAGVVERGCDPFVGDLADQEGEEVEDDVGKDARDDTICDASEK